MMVKMKKKYHFMLALIAFLSLTLFLFSGGYKEAHAARELGHVNGVPRSVDITYFFGSPAAPIRNAESRITDSGRMHNPYDTINIEYLFDVNVESLKAQGYRTLAIEITLDVREVNDGYQYIFVYDDHTSNTWLAGARFSHDDPRLNPDWATYYFYLEVDLFNVTNHDLVIRYDASGKQDDDWINRNLEVEIGASKELRITPYIWQITPLSAGTYTIEQLPLISANLLET